MDQMDLSGVFVAFLGLKAKKEIKLRIVEQK